MRIICCVTPASKPLLRSCHHCASDRGSLSSAAAAAHMLQFPNSNWGQITLSSTLFSSPRKKVSRFPFAVWHRRNFPFPFLFIFCFGPGALLPFSSSSSLFVPSAALQSRATTTENEKQHCPGFAAALTVIGRVDFFSDDKKSSRRNLHFPLYPLPFIT